MPGSRPVATGRLLLQGVKARRRRDLWIPAFVLLVGVTVSALGGSVAARNANASRDRQIEALARESRALIEERLQNYGQILVALQASDAHLFTREQFARFVDRLDLAHRFRGVEATSFNRAVSDAEVSVFEERVRSEATAARPELAGFTVHPRTPGMSHYVVDYIEPLAGNEEVLGFDLASDPRRKAGVESARDSGDVVATAPVRLIQDPVGAGVLLMLAAYDAPVRPDTGPERRRAFTGVYVVALDLDAVLDGVLGIQPRNDVAIYDLGRTLDDPSSLSNPTLLCHTDEPVAPSTPGGGDHGAVDLDVNGRRWQIVATPRVSLGDDLSGWLVGAGGTALSLLAAAFVWQSIRTRSHRSIETLVGALEFGPDAVLVVDEMGTILYANSFVTSVFAAGEPWELVGRPIETLVPERFVVGHQQRRVEYAADPVPRPMGARSELWGRRGDGSEVAIDVRLSPLDVDGRRLFVAAVRDVSERRRAEADREREAQRQAFLGAVARAVAGAADVPAAIESFGELVGSVVRFERLSLAVRDDEETFRILGVWGTHGWRFPAGQTLRVVGDRHWTAYDAGRALLVEDTSAVDAEPVDLALNRLGIRSYVSAPIIAAGRVRALVNFSSTRPNAFTPELLTLLETLVHEAAGPLNTLMALDRERETAERLRQLDALKNEFVGMVAHDLRSPMTVIGGFATMLRQNWTSLDDDQRDHLLGRIEKNVAQLTGFIRDVLDVAKIESGDIDFEIRPFDLAALVTRTVNEMTATEPDRTWSVQIPDGLPRALGDEQRVWRVLSNLLSNASKFSPPGSPVEVDVRAVDDVLEVAVRDRGIGIAPENIDRVFRRFERLRQPVGGEPVEGSGLGLYICKSLLEGQRGRIWVESTPGLGSVFTFSLRAAPAVAPVVP